MSMSAVRGDAKVVPLTEREQRKLRRLFEPVERRLLQIAAVMLRFVPTQEAEDAVQEVFLSFACWALEGKLKCLHFRPIAKIDDAELDESIPACYKFLRRLVIRQCRYFRRQTTFRPRIRVGWVGDVQEWDSNPDRELIREEDISGVRAAMAQLPDDLYQLVVLRFYEECSEKEIAGTLGIPVGTVKSRIFYLKKHMRTLLPWKIVERL